MTTPILHHFAASPFSEKIRLVLGFKRLPWQSVIIPPISPKPDLLALTGGYRRTPVLQVGADIFCDTALICDVLEHLRPDPSLYPDPVKGAGRILAQWADSTLFWTLIAGPKPVAHMYGGAPESAAAFAADRAAMFGAMTRPLAPDASAAARSYLRRLSNMLEDQPFLLGPRPCIADFAVYHSLWFTRIRAPREADSLQHLPDLAAWMERMQAVGHAPRQDIDAQAAIAIAAAAAPATPGQGLLKDSAFQDDHGIALGSQVSIRAESFGAESTTGTLVAATRTHFSLRRSDARAATVHVHFPRVGYVLAQS